MASQKLIQPLENTPTPSFMQLILRNRNDLVQKGTNPLVCEDIVQRDQAFAQEDKRRQDSKRSSPTRQAQPKAKISLVLIKQDNKTNLPCLDKLAIASQEEEEEKTERTQFLKLQGKRTWFTDTKAAFQTMKAALIG